MFLSIFSADVNRLSPIFVLLVALEGPKTSHDNTPAHPDTFLVHVQIKYFLAFVKIFSNCSSSVGCSHWPLQEDSEVFADSAGYQVCPFHWCSILSTDHANCSESFPGSFHRHQENGCPDHWEHVLPDWPEGTVLKMPSNCILIDYCDKH